ncbi:MAG: hypothetical protein ACRYG8_08825 [Janthinobacterium lividum]
MDRCPLCRAALNGGDTCRRCRAELKRAQDVERDGDALLDAAMHRLAVSDSGAAERLLRRALALHAAPEILALWRTVRTLGRELEDEEVGEP